MEGCCGGMIKFYLFITNFAVFAGGIASMGLGIFALVDSDSLKDFIEVIDSDLDVNLFGLAGGLIVGVSLVIAAIAFFGCCGALKESRCLLGIYMLILLCLFGGMIAGAVLASKSNGLDVVKDPMYKSLSAYDPANSATGDNEKAWNTMQDSFKCCGVEGFVDWQNNNTNFANETKVPASCCSAAHGISEDLSQQCQKTPEDDRFSTKLPGCYGEFQSFVQDHSRVILAVAGTTIGVMVLSFLLSFYMVCNID